MIGWIDGLLEEAELAQQIAANAEAYAGYWVLNSCPTETSPPTASSRALVWPYGLRGDSDGRSVGGANSQDRRAATRA